jgi:hypothetical protein
MNLYKNFLKKEDFRKIESVIMGNQFPWYFNDEITKVNKNKDDFQFTYSFIIGGKINCNSDMMSILEPVLSKLKFKKINKIKANLLLRENKIREHGMHNDQNAGVSGILYVNNCNGYTKFENGKKIKSEKNKYIEFNSTLKHTGSSCTDQQRRVVINFNYQ